MRALALAAVACVSAAAGCGGASADDTAGPPHVLRVSVAGDGLLPEIATGVAVGDGRVLTVAHALSGGRAVTVAGHAARVLRVSPRLDLAVLAVPGLHGAGVHVGGDARHARLAVLRDHRAQPLPATVRRHVLVHWRDQPGDRPRDRPGLELAARIDPGDSGAPVLDARGRLLGVLYARSSDDDGTAWAVDASAVRSVLAR